MEINEAFRLLNLMERFKDGQIIVHSKESINIEIHNKGRRKIPKERIEQVKRFWKKHLKSHPLDFDGELLSLESMVKNNNKIILNCKTTIFSEFIASRKICQGKEINLRSVYLDAEYPVPLSFGIVTRTIDGCIVTAIRSNTAFDSGKTTFLPGGYLEPKDANTNISLREEIQREMHEELPGIKISNPKILGIVHSLTESCQPAIMGWMEIPYTAEQVLKTCPQSNEEINKIICIPADINSLREFIGTHNLCIHDVYKIVLYIADVM